jgi:phosphatidylinositol glycan class A protein
MRSTELLPFHDRLFLKVYYLSKCLCGIGACLLTFWFSARQLHSILRRERITHVHCHQMTSGIAYEVGSVAKVMGLPVFLTEHSLFGLNVIRALHLSKVLTPFIHSCD